MFIDLNTRNYRNLFQFKTYTKKKDNFNNIKKMKMRKKYRNLYFIVYIILSKLKIHILFKILLIFQI